MIGVARIYDPERTSYCLSLPIRELTERPGKPKVLQFDQPTAEKNLVKSRQNGKQKVLLEENGYIIIHENKPFQPKKRVNFRNLGNLLLYKNPYNL